MIGCKIRIKKAYEHDHLQEGILVGFATGGSLARKTSIEAHNLEVIGILQILDTLQAFPISRMEVIEKFTGES